MWTEWTHRLIEAAVDEDLGRGDITSRLLAQPDMPAAANVVVREAGVICGLDVAALVAEMFAQRLGTELVCEPRRADGDRAAPGDAVAVMRGPHAAILTAERTLLNFVMRMSGVASLTRQFVDAARAANPRAQILDTRKTVPGWRQLDKYAVRCGGGTNQRFGLFDAVLVKDNHISSVAVERLHDLLAGMIARRPAEAAFVEVEVDGLEQLDAVLGVEGVDIVLLDNFSVERLRDAVALRDARGLSGRVLLEASGGVSLRTIAEIAATGVDRISVGQLTHSAPALDVALDM